MTREDIIRMAQEAGFTKAQRQSVYNIERLERVHALSVAAEREACADICKGYTNGNHDNLADLCEMDIRARGNHASR